MNELDRRLSALFDDLLARQQIGGRIDGSPVIPGDRTDDPDRPCVPEDDGGWALRRTDRPSVPGTHAALECLSLLAELRDDVAPSDRVRAAVEAGAAFLAHRLREMVGDDRGFEFTPSTREVALSTTSLLRFLREGADGIGVATAHDYLLRCRDGLDWLLRGQTKRRRHSVTGGFRELPAGPLRRNGGWAENGEEQADRGNPQRAGDAQLIPTRHALVCLHEALRSSLWETKSPFGFRDDLRGAFRKGQAYVVAQFQAMPDSRGAWQRQTGDRSPALTAVVIKALALRAQHPDPIARAAAWLTSDEALDRWIGHHEEIRRSGDKKLVADYPVFITCLDALLDAGEEEFPSARLAPAFRAADAYWSDADPGWPMSVGGQSDLRTTSTMLRVMASLASLGVRWEDAVSPPVSLLALNSKSPIVSCYVGQTVVAREIRISKSMEDGRRKLLLLLAQHPGDTVPANVVVAAAYKGDRDFAAGCSQISRKVSELNADFAAAVPPGYVAPRIVWSSDRGLTLAVPVRIAA